MTQRAVARPARGPQDAAGGGASAYDRAAFPRDQYACPHVNRVIATENYAGGPTSAEAGQGQSRRPHHPGNALPAAQFAH